MEMHVKFLPYHPSSYFKSHPLAIFFDSTDFDRSISESDNSTIDKFFSSLGFDIEERLELDFEPKMSIPNFKEVMDVFNFDEKWIYKGSSTQPPCKQYAYWQVLRTVYPMKDKYLKGMRYMLA